MAGKSDGEVGLELGRAMAAVPDLRCALTLVSCLPRDVGCILQTAEGLCPGVPFVGATAGVNSVFFNSGSFSSVFDGEGVYGDTLIAVLLHGADLHVRTTCNFGWTSVGKTMTVTKLRDPYTVREIDGRPAADVYEKYLGIPWRTNALSMENICEFPLTSERWGMRLARIPYAWSAEGDLNFGVTMREGEQLRLNYGLPQQIFSQVEDDAEAFRGFGAEALFLVVCMNRMIFLREAERRETDAYRAVVPGLAFMHGNSEIYRDQGVGGEMHSALIAVGLREGDLCEPAPEPTRADGAPARCDRVIPLEDRLMTFLRAVTSDLEEVTRGLLELSENLEDEVERKTRENQSLSLHVVQTLAEAIDAKDNYTSGHSGRVAKYSREIARRAGYSQKQQDDIFVMGLLHDVGKIGVPDAVINKPGKLTDEEFAQIKTHPVMGARILAKVEEMPGLATGARWHHERYDGRGYPDGLSGEDIPEEARIIAVADAYDAMTSNRSYRSGMEQAAVREQVATGRGTQFDPRFVDIMLAMIDDDPDYEMRER